MYAHPGKKLNFMGNEIGHFREWDEKREQDWNLLTFPAHQDFHRFMTDLNHFYLEHPSFSEQDYSLSGFHWLECNAEDLCVYAFSRFGKKETVTAVFNFSDQEREDFCLEIPDTAKLKRIFSSNLSAYGGSEQELEKEVVPDAETGDFHFTLKPFSAEYYLNVPTKK